MPVHCVNGSAMHVLSIVHMLNRPPCLSMALVEAVIFVRALVERSDRHISARARATDTLWPLDMISSTIINKRHVFPDHDTTVL